MNQARKRTGTKKVLSMILVLVMLLSLLSMAAFTLPAAASSDGAASNDDFMRIFHLDCGRKYFSVSEIKDLIDAASASNYTHVELAIGNDALRFLLNDMSVTVNGTTYSSENVKAGIQAGNTNYTPDSTGELTQAEMDTIIAYAKDKNISIIPLINTPGHMDAILDCMTALNVKNAAYNGSTRTMDVTNTTAVAFTQALLQKYITYFAGKGCKFFNMGADEYANDKFTSGAMGFGDLIKNGNYGKYADYINNIASIIENAGMKPMAFNDGIYYNGTTTSNGKTNGTKVEFDKNIIICYWTAGFMYNGAMYSPASASFLASKQHKIISTNDAWYYVLGRANGTYGLSNTKNNVQNTKVTSIPGDKNAATPVGAMMCLWCDSPSASYSPQEQNNVKSLIQTLADSNPTYFTKSTPTDPGTDTSDTEFTISVGSSKTITVNGDRAGEYQTDKPDVASVTTKHQQSAASSIKYSATASASIEAYSTNNGWVTYPASNVIDGNTSTKYWSYGNQTQEAYVQVDLGAAIPFDKVRLTSPVNSGDNCENAKVLVSADGSAWTEIGRYTGSTTPTLFKNTLDKVRYIKVEITTAKNNWWQLSEIEWGNTVNGSFTRMPASGTVTTEAKDETAITFTGLSVGDTTVTINGVLYTIHVVDKAPENALTAKSIDLEYWITNFEVYEGTSTSTDHIKTINSSDAAGAEGIEIAKIAPNHAYSFFEGTKDVYYWQAMRLDIDNLQTNASGDDETADGTTLTHIRYYNDAWQYKTTDGAWHYFVSTDQLVAYYLQKTEVTQEIVTYMKDWGYGTSDTTPDTSHNKGQVALTVAVVYPDGTVSPAEGSMYSSSTVIYNFQLEQNGTWVDRDIGIIAPKNNSDYNISKITVTDGTRDSNSSSNVWDTTDTITWKKKTNVAGEKWYDETEVWNKSSGTTPMVNGKDENIDSTVRMWPAKNTAKLVLIYLEPVEKETNLNVQYIDLNANNHVFHSYQVAMKYNQGEDVPTFTEALMQGNTVIGGKGPWNSNVSGDANYLPDEAYVTNSSNTKQTFKKDITTIPEINGIYASGLYKYMKADISEDGKTLRLYYDLNATAGKTFVVDFGLPVEIPFSDFGITNVSDVTVSFNEQNTAMTERQGNYGNGKIDMTAKTVTYTLTKTLDAKIPIPVYVADQSGNVQMLSVNVMPATSVYYEDSFATFTNANGEKDHLVAESDNVANGTWVTVTDGITQTDVKQALEALGSQKNVYGYDGAYANSSKFSMGSATKVTVNADTSKLGQSPTATFTFKGTGFDVISLTGNHSGTVMYTVKNTETGVSSTNIVNTYYGYKYENGEWVKTDSADPSALYQIPVIKENLTYGTYEVTISVLYGKYFNSTANDWYTFWLDAIRVYNPMGVNNETYKQDNEGYPQYIMLRDSLAKDNTATADAVFIDGGKTAEIATYANYGPNNEVYLTNGQAITFTVPADNNIASIQIGAKAPDGRAAQMVVTGGNKLNKELSTATEMYYTIGTAGGSFTITNMGDGILSLTNLKITFTTSGQTVTLKPLSTEAQTAAVMSVRALFAAPEQTFKPDRFEVSWSRNVRKGGTATLTVRASADVEAITVNGEKISTYTTKTARSVWGAKETYHVFTYRVKNAVAGDYTIYALNADGVASDPITAQLTVRPSIRDWWNGIFDKWKH